MAPQTTNAPFLDAAELFGSGYAIPQFTSAPFLDSGVGFAPNATIGTVVEGMVVYAGATVLDESFSRSFRDELVGAGSFQLSLANDDAAMPAFDDVLTFKLAGQARFAGLVESKRVVTFGSGEGADEVTSISGRGRLAVVDRATVEPARGLDALPVEITRSFSWVSVDFDDSDWPDSKRIRRADVPTARAPYRYSPEWWPDKTSWWVWANRSDVSELDAPGGRCLFRQTITLAADATISIFAAMDNYGAVYFDGARVIDSENDASSYTIGRRVQIEATAGTHVLAANVLNTGRGGGLNWSVWTVDAEGLLDELVDHSDNSLTRCLPYPFPDNPPTVTFGWVARQVLEEAQARGELAGVILDFSDLLDSDGEPWSPVAEITVDVGRTFLEMVEALSDWLIDVQMAPGANVLRAWNWSQRGSTPGVTVAATTDPNTSEVEALAHDGRHARANRLLIKYRQGYTEVTDSASIAAIGQRTAFLDVGDVNTESTAKGIGTRLLALRKDPSFAHTLTLAPVSSTPYETFDNGDYITHPDEDGSTSLSRVRSVAVLEDDNGVLTYMLELHDIRQEVEERQENWLQRKAMGTLAGGARAVGKSGDALAPAVGISTTNVAEFSFQDPTAGAITGKRPADSSGNLIEIYVEISTEDDVATSSSTQVRVWEYVYGSPATSIGTVTVPAGETIGELDLEASKTFRNIYKYRAEVVTVGGNVNGVDVQLRAI